MGWDVTDTGFQIVLSPDIPDIAEREAGPAVNDFLAKEGLTRDDIERWLAHPGGPAVIDALERGLGLPAGAFSQSYESLAHLGNLSSVSVLLILQEALREPPSGDSYGLMLAMGPAFCTELALLHWNGGDAT